VRLVSISPALLIQVQNAESASVNANVNVSASVNATAKKTMVSTNTVRPPKNVELMNAPIGTTTIVRLKSKYQIGLFLNAGMHSDLARLLYMDFKYKIIKLNINRGAELMRTQFERAAGLSSVARSKDIDIVGWWKNLGEDFKKEVFKPRSRDFDIEVTAFLITRLVDVTIYASDYDEDIKKYRGMYVISNENVVEMKELNVNGSVDIQPKSLEKHIVEPTKPVLVTWLDAISNHTSGTAEEIMEKSKITPIYFAGFLIGTANEALYVATAYNKEVSKYRGILIIPIMNVVSVESLDL